jgi:hypothetical protein
LIVLEGDVYGGLLSKDHAHVLGFQTRPPGINDHRVLAGWKFFSA